MGADLHAEIARLKKELEFANAVAEGRDPTGPASRGCPRCGSCGRDGSEAAVTRESCLRLVFAAQDERSKLARQIEETPDPHPGEMPPPPPVFGDLESTEVVRVWKTGVGLNGFMVRPTSHTPIRWGIVMADTIRYICHSMNNAEVSIQKEDGETVEMTYEDILSDVMTGFEAEMGNPTDEPKDWTPDS